ncbi:MAG: thermonuclease family protein [Gammaproteobacteria bacterium]
MRAPTLVMLLVCAAIGAAVQVGCAPEAAEITGRVSKAIDGDSFEIGSDRVRLFGIDAPEGRQDCRRNGQTWRCGEEAAAKLRSLVQGATLRCTPHDTDEYGRSVAVCKNGSTDINAEMVRAGLALAYRRYSTDYVDEENDARNAKRGLWAGEFTKPWDYRRESREETPRPQQSPAPRASGSGGAAGTQPPSSGCKIKGNINTRGDRIYHVPGSDSYDSTVINERFGERWFCSEAEARAAGWRAAGVRKK